MIQRHAMQRDVFASWLTKPAAIHKRVVGLIADGSSAINRRDFPFELIHAHFTYPDGVAAVELGKRYRVPVAITEHIPWDVWREKYPGVLARAARAAGECACHISVSESVRKSVARSVASEGNLVVVPNGVDGSVFRIAPDSPRRIPNQILFAGAVRPVKGVDVLLGALRRMVDRGRDAKLTIVGEAFFDSYRKEEQRLRQIAKDLALEDRVHFAGKKSPHDLARCMQAASVLVLPSRIESFGAVLLEALACGTPVVSTRSGGPEEIVTEQVGVLTPPGDPEALARGIEHVLDRQDDYEPGRLRAYALETFGLESVGDRLARLYRDAILNYGERATAPANVRG